MHLDEDKLRSKGWTEEEIRHTRKLVNKVKRKKHPHQHMLLDVVYWSILLFTIAIIISISYWVVPLFVFANTGILLFLIIIIGLLFGGLFGRILHDLDHLERHHHLLFTIIAPITGIASFGIVLAQANTFAKAFNNQHNVLVTGALFVISFLAPYIYHSWQQEKKKKKHKKQKKKK